MAKWRKVSESATFTQWYDDKQKISVFVYYQDYIPELKKKDHWVYAVTTDAGKTVLKETNTKTKAQAMRLAKKYMKSH